MVMVLLIVGCSNPTVITINRTINKTIYLNRTIIINNTIPCNITKLEPEINISFDRSYTLELIRRIKFLEGRQDLYWNDTECHYDLNRTEVRLEECEEELCNEWNSSWC